MINAVLLVIGIISVSPEWTIDSSFKDVFMASSPAITADMDELVKQSIHADDRRFSKVG